MTQLPAFGQGEHGAGVPTPRKHTPGMGTPVMSTDTRVCRREHEASRLCTQAVLAERVRVGRDSCGRPTPNPWRKGPQPRKIGASSRKGPLGNVLWDKQVHRTRCSEEALRGRAALAVCVCLQWAGFTEGVCLC